ncbi:hypothetical protein LWC34_50880 [Kibdelosporangium philippinense]|uniref:Uncharacterized protein n=1 Tax=Kibdelosporangium philippinense TaxID=211113 RepID=A0ABS8ZTP2_9PSEU|nr:hypothetical protein [Kibdelosporangium philippinense]MCE7011057.1 hypothetical protein [Kibdelosporangium philippinense]
MTELDEAEYMAQIGLYRPGGPLGIALRRFGEGGTALSVRNDPSDYWNKVLGFTEVTGELIESLLDFYRAEGSPLAVLQIAPEILPDDWPEICAKFGIEPTEMNFAKVAAPISDVRPTGETDLPIRELTRDDGAQWLDLVTDVYEMKTTSQGRQRWSQSASLDTLA